MRIAFSVTRYRRMLLCSLAGVVLLHPNIGVASSGNVTSAPPATLPESAKPVRTAVANTLRPAFQGQLLSDRIRLQLNWEGNAPISAEVKEKRLYLRFGQKVLPRLGNVLRALYPHVSQVALVDGGQTVVLTLRDDYPLTLTEQGKNTVIDLALRPARPGSEELPVLTAAAADQLAPTRAAAVKTPPSKPATTQTPAPKPPEKPVQTATQKRSLDPVLPAYSRNRQLAMRPVVPPVPAKTPAVTKAAAPTTPPKQLAATTPAPAKPAQSPVSKPVPRQLAAAEPVSPAPLPVNRPAAPPRPALAVASASPVVKPAPEAVTPAEKPATIAARNDPAEAVAALSPAAGPTVTAASVTPVTSAKLADASPVAINTQESYAGTESGHSGGQVEPITLSVKDDPLGPQLHIPWTERTAAAVYERSGKLWMVFDKQAELLTGKLAGQSAFTNPAVNHQQGYTIFRIDMPKDGELNVTRDKFDWVVQLRNDGRKLTYPLPLTVSTAPPLKPHLFAPLLQTGEPIVIEDPLIGDQLHIVPFYKANVGVTQKRQFVEFTLPQTYQGLVMSPLADGPRIVMTRNGFRITSRDGLRFSEDLPELDTDLPDYETATLFPYEQWKPPMVPVKTDTPAEKKDIGEKEEPEMRQLSFDEYRHELMKKVISTSGERSLQYRLKVAQLYLSEGLGAEANGILRSIAQDAPEFYTARHLEVLTAASNFLMYRVLEATQALHEPALDNVEEAKIWRGFLDTMLGTSNAGFDYADAYDKFLRHYPPRLKERLSILAADYYINQGKFNTALAVFKTMSAENLVLSSQHYIDFLVAKISAETGDSERAREKWQAMADMVDNRFIRARAAFSLTALDLAEGKITPKQAIRQLEKIRIVWRGDTLEMNLLSALGDLYSAEQNYTEALRAWREVTANFPDTLLATETVQKMAATFKTLYNDGAADAMEPVEALALYYEFRDLTPVGKEGDRMIRNLAQRLVQIDLLDRAAALLTHQIRFRSAGEERSQLGADLAQVRLLNREPALALEALESTDFAQNSRETRQQRAQLAAEAYIAQKQFPEALAALKTDKSDKAMSLRSEIYWKQGEWNKLVAEAETMLNNKPNLTEPMTKDQLMTSLRLAVGYIQTGDFERMQLLETAFTPLANDPKLKQALAYITGNSARLDHTNLAQINRLIDDTEQYLSQRAGSSPFPAVATTESNAATEPAVSTAGLQTQ